MEKDTFLKLLSKKYAGELSASEANLLEQAMAEQDEFGQISQAFEQYCSSSEGEMQMAGPLQKIWAQIAKAEEDKPVGLFDYSIHRHPGLFRISFFKVAAVLAILCCVSVFGYYLYQGQSGKGFVRVATQEQKTFKILAEGTRIWLNRRSNIRYNNDFGKIRREVFLDGEAYFDVARNPAVPLIIHAGAIDVKVKGTAFNLNAYPQNKQISISLDRGLIEVSDRLNQRSPVLLRPNEKLTFLNAVPKNHANPFSIQAINNLLLLQASYWTSDTLSFSNEKLRELSFRMEKKYQVKIEIQSALLKEKRFSGAFISETLEQAMEALKLAYPFSYRIKDKLVVIKD